MHWLELFLEGASSLLIKGSWGSTISDVNPQKKHLRTHNQSSDFKPNEQLRGLGPCEDLQMQEHWLATGSTVAARAQGVCCSTQWGFCYGESHSISTSKLLNG